MTEADRSRLRSALSSLALAAAGTLLIGVPLSLWQRTEALVAATSILGVGLLIFGLYHLIKTLSSPREGGGCLLGGSIGLLSLLVLAFLVTGSALFALTFLLLFW